jgi:hypothetical protein
VGTWGGGANREHRSRHRQHIDRRFGRQAPDAQDVSQDEIDREGRRWRLEWLRRNIED